MLLQSRLLSSLLLWRETLFMRVAVCYYSSGRWAGRHNLAAWRPPSALRGAWMRSLEFLCEALACREVGGPQGVSGRLGMVR